jgi:hypothetical protein
MNRIFMLVSDDIAEVGLSERGNSQAATGFSKQVAPVSSDPLNTVG